jgi:predicted nucleic acid-binding Zn ribbon protein
VQRLLSSPAIQFKGSGWYITDYSQKGKSGKSDTTSGDKSAGAKSESGGKSESSTNAAANPAASSSTTGESKD